MGLWRKHELPTVNRPEGCSGLIRIIESERFKGVNRLNGLHLVANLACAGFCEPGQDPATLSPVALAETDIAGDGAADTGNPSRRGRRLGYARIAALAEQRAELVCATCPASVLKDVQALRQAELRARIAEELERQALAAKAASEMLADSSPDVRAMLGMDGQLPPTPSPAPELPPPAPPQTPPQA